MSFKVKLFSGAPDYETLHVAKLVCFPLEQRDYKPYSQARICFAADGLHIQLLAFESEPLPDSAMQAVIKLDEHLAPLILTMYADGRFTACLGDKAIDASVHAFTGEDLQGVYWGGNVFVALPVLMQCFCSLHLKKGLTFQGNLYKLCENAAKPHYGCFYPADFSIPLSDPANLGAFVIIDY